MMQNEKRRFPRARVHTDLSDALAVLSAHIIWPNLETSEIMDLSYKGCAARRPGLFPLAVHEHMTVKLELGRLPAFGVEARVVWCNLDSVGLDIQVLPGEGHLAMARFLSKKLLGAQLKLIAPSMVAKKQSFHYWFQGPSATHVFIWLDGERQVERVSLDMDGEIVDFSRGTRLRWPSPQQSQALLVLSQMDNHPFSMEDFVRSLGST